MENDETGEDEPAMKVFAIADTHLSFATPGKEMHLFGEQWRDHAERIADNWRRLVAPGDLVLVPGDISWAMRPSEAQADLEFLHRLPGTKVLIRGNHEYWWGSLTKVRRMLPPSMFAIDGDAIEIGGVGIGGTRLWNCPGMSFANVLSRPTPSAEQESPADDERDAKIWQREVSRLGRALADLDRLEGASPLRLRVAMVHYPPCDRRLSPNVLTAMFERARIEHVVFGHLHGVGAISDNIPLGERSFGELNGVRYHLTACDFLDFAPLYFAELP
jgi:predicted phosphohydrolase